MTLPATEANEAVNALDAATKQIGLVLSDPGCAEIIKGQRFGDVMAAHVRLCNVAYELKKGE